MAEPGASEGQRAGRAAGVRYPQQAEGDAGGPVVDRGGGLRQLRAHLPLSAQVGGFEAARDPGRGLPGGLCHGLWGLGGRLWSALQRRGEVGNRREAGRRLRVEGAGEDGFDLRPRRHPALGEGEGRQLGDLAQHLVLAQRVVAAVGAGGEEVEQRRQRRLLAGERRGRRRGALEEAARQLGLVEEGHASPVGRLPPVVGGERAREAEVDQPDRTGALHQEVSRVDVAVDDAGGVEPPVGRRHRPQQREERAAAVRSGLAQPRRLGFGIDPGDSLQLEVDAPVHLAGRQQRGPQPGRQGREHLRLAPEHGANARPGPPLAGALHLEHAGRAPAVEQIQLGVVEHLEEGDDPRREQLLTRLPPRRQRPGRLRRGLAVGHRHQVAAGQQPLDQGVGAVENRLGVLAAGAAEEHYGFDQGARLAEARQQVGRLGVEDLRAGAALGAGEGEVALLGRELRAHVVGQLADRDQVHPFVECQRSLQAHLSSSPPQAALNRVGVGTQRSTSTPSRASRSRAKRAAAS